MADRIEEVSVEASIPEEELSEEAFAGYPDPDRLAWHWVSEQYVHLLKRDLGLELHRRGFITIEKDREKRIVKLKILVAKPLERDHE